jgi:hypothetical protein
MFLEQDRSLLFTGHLRPLLKFLAFELGTLNSELAFFKVDVSVYFQSQSFLVGLKFNLTIP